VRPRRDPTSRGRAAARAWSCWEVAMLYWAAVFFVIAIVAALFGFGNIAVAAAAIAKVLFFVFVVLFLLSLLAHLVYRTRH
jgi:uncharacterized membrane protein YtjA (UPF0391 family)